MVERDKRDRRDRWDRRGDRRGDKGYKGKEATKVVAISRGKVCGIATIASQTPSRLFCFSRRMSVLVAIIAICVLVVFLAQYCVIDGW